MRGVGYDIANSSILSNEEKEILIKACENYFYQDMPFTNIVESSKTISY